MAKGKTHNGIYTDIYRTHCIFSAEMFCTLPWISEEIIPCVVFDPGLNNRAQNISKINKKVLLHERKRHTACRISSTPYAVLSGGGTPSQVPPNLTWLVGTPSWVTHIQEWGTPWEENWYQSLGYPLEVIPGPVTWVPPRKDMIPVEVL